MKLRQMAIGAGASASMLVSLMAAADPPHVSGIVERDDGRLVGARFVDVDTGLDLLIGVDPEQYCYAPIEYDAVPWQYLVIPNSGFRFIAGVEGQVQAHVYALGDPIPQSACAYVYGGQQELAGGTANLLYIDNDFFGALFEEDNNWTNAFSFRAKGELYDPSQVAHTLKFFYHRAWNSEGLFKEQTRIRLD